MNVDPERGRDEVFELAYRTFVNRGYDKARFRRREE